MKLTNCKRCDTADLLWSQGSSGKWVLKDKNGEQHHCDDGKIKSVKCKYCNADDLYWAEELNPVTKEKKAILTESYGLPHACDERMAMIAKEKQDKKDKYEAEKKRINAIADGPCEPCKGTGNAIVLGSYTLCTNCSGYARFNQANRKIMLSHLRRKIWPNMPETYSTGYRKRW